MATPKSTPHRSKSAPFDMSANSNIRVAVRFRPLISREKNDTPTLHWKVVENGVHSQDPTIKPFIFDRVFDQPTTTKQVYNEIAQSIVMGVMEGFNGTIFAYGQTASGKTFTMMGDSKSPGVIPMAIKDIFNAIENTVDREFLIRVSYLEIYNEQVSDLLSDPNKHLDVREGKGGTVYVEGLKEELANSEEQILGYMKKGENNRHFGQTKMNEHSSRSHTIFQLTIESRERAEDPNQSYDGVVKVSQLNLVDLAGSEKAKHTGATGQRLMEGGFINKSLFVLGQVISQLSERSQFVSYRDSRLTRILQNSLGGNSQTTIICNCTLASLEETLSTLRFATSAKRIKNTPVLNEAMSDGAMLKRYKKEMQKLQKQLNELKLGDVHVIREENEELQQMLAEKENLQKLQDEKINKLKEFICVSSRPQPKQSKKKRRETWCPGKARMSMAPGAMICHTLDLAAKRRFPSAGVEEEEEEEACSSFVTSRRRGESLEASFTSEEAFHSFSSDTGKRRVRYGATEVFQCPMEPCEENTSSDNMEMELLRAELAEKTQRIDELMTRLEAYEANTTPPDPPPPVDGSIKELQDQVSLKTAECARLQQTIEDNLLYNTSRQRELQEELEFLKDSVREAPESTNKYYELEEKYNKLQAEFQETFTFSSDVINDLKKTQEAKETATKELDRLSIAYERLTEELSTKEHELQELQEFTRMEKDFKNESILEKNEMRSKLADLQSKHTDFDVHMEVERTKYKHRERELTEQLDSVYEEMECIRKNSNTSYSIHQSTPIEIRKSRSLRRSSCGGSTSSDVTVDETTAAPPATVSALEELGIFEDPDGPPEASVHEDVSIQHVDHQLTELHADCEQQLQLLTEQLSCAQQHEAAQAEEIQGLRQQLGGGEAKHQEQEIDDSKVSTLQTDLENAVLRITELEESLQQNQDHFVKQGGESEDDLQAAKERISELEMLLTQNQADMLKQATESDTSSPLQLELEEAHSDLEHAYMKIGELEMQVDEAQNMDAEQGGVLEADLQAAKERIAELETLLTQNQADVPTQAGDEAELQSLRLDLEKAHNDLEGSKSQVATLEDLLQKKQEESQTSAMQGGESEDDLQVAKERISELEMLLIQDQTDVPTQTVDEGELQSLKLDLEKAHNDLEEFKSQVATSEDLLQKKQEESESTEKQDEVSEADYQAAKERICQLEALLTEAQADVLTQSGDEAELQILKLDLEKAHNDLEESKSQVATLEDLLQTKQEESEITTKQCEQSEEDFQAAKQRISELEMQLTQAEADVKAQDSDEAVLQSLRLDLEKAHNDLEDSMSQVATLEDLLLKKQEESETSTTLAEADHRLKHLQKEHELLLDRYAELESITSTTKGRLLSEENRDLDLLKQLEHLEKVHKDFKATYAQTTKENQETICYLEREVYELKCQLQKSRGDSELASHRAKKAEDEKEVLKGELRTLESTLEQNESRGRQQNMDPDKMMDRIKKLSVSVDLTNQRCQNYEVKIKKLEASEAKNGDAVFERNNLQVEVRELQHSLKEKLQEMALLQQRYSNSHMEISELRLQAVSLQRQVDLNTNADYPNQLKQTQHLVTELETKLSSAQDRLLQAENAVSAADGRVAAHKQEISDMQQELAAYKTDMSGHKDQLESLEAKIVVLQKDLQSARELQTLAEEKARAAATQAEEMASTGDSEAEQLRRDVERAQEELCACQRQLQGAQELQAQAEEDARVAASEAAEAVNSYSNEMDELRAEIDSYQSSSNEQCELYQQTIAQLESRVSELQEEASHLQQQLAQAQAEAEAAVAHAQFAEAQAADLNTLSSEERETLQQELQRYQDLVESGNLKLQQHEEDMETLSRDKQEAQDLIEAGEAKLKQLQTELETFSREKQEAEDGIEAGKANLEQLQTEVDSLRQEKVEAEDLIEAGKAKLEQLQTELEMLSHEKKEAERVASDQSECHNSRIQELEALIQDSQKHLEKLETELKAALSRAESAEAQVAAQRIGGSEELHVLQQKYQESEKARLEEHQKEIEALIQQKENAERVASDQSEHHNSRVQELEAKIQDSQEHLEKLETELEATLNRAESAEAQITALSVSGSEELHKLQQKYQDLAQSEKTKLEEHQKAVEALTKKKEDTELMVDAVKEERDHYFFMVADTEKEIGAVKQELEAEKVKVIAAEARAKDVEETLQRDRQILEEDLASAKEEMEYYKTTIEEVEDELVQARNQIYEFQKRPSGGGGSGEDPREVSSLKARLEKSKQQVSKLNSHLWKMDATHKSEISTQNETIAELDKKVKQLMSELTLSTSNCKSAEDCQVLQKKNVDMRLRINALEMEIRKDNEPLKETIKNLKDELREVSRYSNIQKSELRKLRNELDESRSCPTCADIKPENMAETFRQQYVAEAEKNELRHKIKSLTTRLNQREEALKTASTQMSKLETQAKKFDRFSKQLRDDRDRVVLKEILESNKENETAKTEEELPDQCKSQ